MIPRNESNNVTSTHQHDVITRRCRGHGEKGGGLHRSGLFYSYSNNLILVYPIIGDISLFQRAQITEHKNGLKKSLKISTND